jgi:hypothetical protein
MKPLFTKEEFENAKSEDLLGCECKECKNIFYKTKHYLQDKRCKHDYCSLKCSSLPRITKENVICTQCGKEFIKKLNQIKRSPNHFCSHSCHASYQHSHKTTGYRRSKLEVWLETKLITLYPNLKFEFNKKDAINSELDIYIPELKLAFELNGIFHYEPIFGQEQLEKINNNDNRKFQACVENNIELCIIDSSKLSYFKESNCVKYLDIITNIINLKIN